MKILIVDDSKAMRMIVRRTLRQAGLEDATVEEAGDGKEGLSMVAAAAPDLVLSDWNMPNMNGIDMLKELRKAGKKVPLGFVTTECTEEMRKLASDAGASFMITKPFTADDFKVAIRAAKVA